MDSQTKARYSVLRDKDWETLGYTEIPYFRQYEPELEGDIHPIFQYTIPGRPDSFPIWPFYTQQEYQGHLVDLNPVFRLATKILRSPGSLDFFYWLIFSPRTHAEPPVWNLGERVSQYRRDKKPEDDRRRMATAALDRFALTHRITIGGIEQAGLTTAMLSEQEEGINIKDDSSTPNGVKSWIALNEKFLDQLARLRAEGSANHLKIFKLRLKMAITILHEVAHALGNARNLKYLENVKKERALQSWAEFSGTARVSLEPVSNEDLFEDENCAETGYSWEAWVFGGIVELDHLDASNPLMVSKWPSFLTSKEYLRRGGWKESVTRYLVSMHYRLNMNRQGFWENLDPHDTTALYIQKVIGIRIRCPHPEIDSDWYASDSSEGIWRTEEQRSSGWVPSARVSRMIPNWTIVDPSTSRANESDDERLRRDTAVYLQNLSMR